MTKPLDCHRDGIREDLSEKEIFTGVLKIEKVIYHVKKQEKEFQGRYQMRMEQGRRKTRFKP